MDIRIIENFNCFCDECFPDKDDEDRKMIEDIKNIKLDMLRKLEERLISEN